jgi:hypothetical protein
MTLIHDDPNLLSLPVPLLLKYEASGVQIPSIGGLVLKRPSITHSIVTGDRFFNKYAVPIRINEEVGAVLQVCDDQGKPLSVSNLQFIVRVLKNMTPAEELAFASFICLTFRTPYFS